VGEEPAHEVVSALEVGGTLYQTWQEAIEGSLQVHCDWVQEGLYRVTVRVSNMSPLEDAAQSTRDEALARSFVSTHTVLGVERGEFVSLTLTDQEKHAMAALDPQTCAMLQRIEALAGEEILGLHGAVRGLRTLDGEE
jgi:peptidyl-tRNA hydrolase